MKKAWELIDKDKKAIDFEGDEKKKEKYEELALVVHLALLKSTDGEDNELVRAQDPEDISAAWNKLVAKHEGEKDEILLKTFDDLILESLTELKGTDIYVERYETRMRVRHVHRRSRSERVELEKHEESAEDVGIFERRDRREAMVRSDRGTSRRGILGRKLHGNLRRRNEPNGFRDVLLRMSRRLGNEEAVEKFKVAG